MTIKQYDTNLHTSQVNDFKVGQLYLYNGGENVTQFILTETRSNVVVLERPSKTGGHRVLTLTYLEAYDSLELIDNPTEFIQQQTDIAFDVLKNAQRLLETSVNDLLHKDTSSNSTALVPIGMTQNIESYKNEMVTFRDKVVPELQSKIEDASKNLNVWITYKKDFLTTNTKPTLNHIDSLNKQINNISLYAGIGETSILVKDGNPGEAVDKLHVYQDMMYMDEQCLLNLNHDGIDIHNIGEFDEWLIREDNFTRLFPFNKTAIAFQVRRKDKNYDMGDFVLSMFVNMRMSQLNKSTFLYIRNGEQLHRIDFDDFDFNGKLFSGSEYLVKEPLYMKTFANRIEGFITKREYDAMMEDYEKKKAENELWKVNNPYDQWIKDNPHGSNTTWLWRLPHTHLDNPNTRYSPLDNTNPMLDIGVKKLKDDFDYFNQVAIIFQGLYDRTKILSPHMNVKLSSLEQFKENVVLINRENAIHHGDEPDIHQYLMDVNVKSEVGDVFTGVLELWVQREKDKYPHREYGPDVSLGPDSMCVCTKVTKTHYHFEWRYINRRYETSIGRMRVPVGSKVLNMTKYEKGDYKRFMRDSRSLMKYRSWGKLLMCAETFKG